MNHCSTSAQMLEKYFFNILFGGNFLRVKIMECKIQQLRQSKSLKNKKLIISSVHIHVTAFKFSTQLKSKVFDLINTQSFYPTSMPTQHSEKYFMKNLKQFFCCCHFQAYQPEYIHVCDAVELTGQKFSLNLLSSTEYSLMA